MGAFWLNEIINNPLLEVDRNFPKLRKFINDEKKFNELRMFINAEIEKGMEDIKAGRVYSADEVEAEMKREFGI